MISKIKKIYKQIIFHTVKLPLIYISIPVGFVFEYLITFPYIVLCTLDRLPEKDNPSEKNKPLLPDSVKKKK